MGLGLQIACQGFAGFDDVERVAGVELLRLERQATDVVNSHLTIEAYSDASGAPLYDARLDLITRTFDLIPVERGTAADLGAAIHRAFDNVLRLLKLRQVSSA
ncbi:hypothetical protein [Caballeronia sp. RCC_10]|uniref:hypothetical protein n=1 Tax=Caballeronia sp. RCC_10 TaxID=3239227 RepID=UPI003525255A